MRIGFRSKVLLSISVISVLSAVAISAVYFNRSAQMVEQNYIRSLWNTLTVSTETFEDTSQDAYAVAVKLSNDKTLVRMLEVYTAQKGGADQSADITAYLKQFQPDGGVIDSIYVYVPERKQVLTSIEYHAVQEIFIPENYPWLKIQGGTGLTPAVLVDRISRAPKYVITYSREVLSSDGSNPIAILAVNLDERKLSYQLLGNSERLGGNKYFLIDPNGVIASGVNIAYIEHLLMEQEGMETLEEQQWGRQGRTVDVLNKMLVTSVRSPMTGYRIVCVANRSELIHSLRQQQGFVLTLLALTLIVMLLFASAMSTWMYKPVKLLKDTMERVSEGDLSARTAVVGNDEIAMLGKGFNETIARIETLIDELVSERTRKKEAELEALQYQITPHFMYNTLNSIKYAAVLQGAERIGEHLGAFIELLQASINRKGPFLTVQEEVRMVENYVKLQRFRYMGSFTAEYVIAPEAEALYVPRLLLQPLVENAIIHGNNVIGAGSHIQVTASLGGEQLILSVFDSGYGMTQEKIEDLLKGKASGVGQFSGIGVGNILERLRLYYGDRAGLNYFCEVEGGTQARIYLPASKDPTEYAV